MANIVWFRADEEDSHPGFDDLNNERMELNDDGDLVPNIDNIDGNGNYE
jgi:hypothetical protein